LAVPIFLVKKFKDRLIKKQNTFILALAATVAQFLTICLYTAILGIATGEAGVGFLLIMFIFISPLLLGINALLMRTKQNKNYTY
jgi:hypothetical protein